MKKIVAVIINCTLSILGVILLGTTILATHMKWNSFGYYAPYDFFKLLQECNLWGLFIVALILLLGGYIMAVIYSLSKEDK